MCGRYDRGMGRQAEYEVRCARSDEDLRQILALQAVNLREAVGEDERRAQGFVTLRHDAALLREMCGSEAHVVATARGSDEVVGYALVMLKEFRTRLTLLEPMFARLEGLTFRGRPMRDVVGDGTGNRGGDAAGKSAGESKGRNGAWRWYVMGQVCVAKAHRGQGLVERMYQEHRRLMSPRYDLLVTEIDRANTRSMRAHERAGWVVMDEYPSDGREWVVVGMEM